MCTFPEPFDTATRDPETNFVLQLMPGNRLQKSKVSLKSVPPLEGGNQEVVGQHGESQDEEVLGGHGARQEVLGEPGGATSHEVGNEHRASQEVGDNGITDNRHRKKQLNSLSPKLLKYFGKHINSAIFTKFCDLLPRFGKVILVDLKTFSLIIDDKRFVKGKKLIQFLFSNKKVMPSISQINTFCQIISQYPRELLSLLSKNVQNLIKMRKIP